MQIFVHRVQAQMGIRGAELRVPSLYDWLCHKSAAHLALPIGRDFGLQKLRNALGDLALAVCEVRDKR